MGELTHLGPDGRASMVDVTGKDETVRRAVASGRVRLSEGAWAVVRKEGVEKGDIASIAELAGVMAAKRTADLIPLCHPLPLTRVKVSVEPDDAMGAFVVTAEAKTTGKTGVEMEALTAASVACLTIYDMAKAVDKAMVIEDVKLLEKTGGKSGDYRRADGA